MKSLGSDGSLGGGGHRHGRGLPYRSEFPEDWDDDKVVAAIKDVARNPGATVDRGPGAEPRGGARFRAEGERDGVPIVVTVKQGGKIWNAYPADESWPRNPGSAEQQDVDEVDRRLARLLGDLGGQADNSWIRIARLDQHAGEFGEATLDLLCALDQQELSMTASQRAELELLARASGLELDTS